MISWLTEHLSWPEARELDLDSAAAREIHRSIIRRNRFLQAIYRDRYHTFRQQVEALGNLQGDVIELGSGGGFIKEVLPSVIATDVLPGPGIDRVVSAEAIPFTSSSLKAILALDVLHHLADPERFFSEAARCLVAGGRVVLIEPAYSAFSQWVYKHFHNEPFDPHQKHWKTPPRGRMSTSNMALPWIIFHRDRRRFESAYPSLRIVSLHPHTVLTYPLSGGLSWRPLAPAWVYPIVGAIDQVLERMKTVFPLFETIVLEKRP